MSPGAITYFRYRIKGASSNPEEDTIIKTGVPAKPLDPSNIFSAYNAVASRLGIDATKPLPPYSERWKWVESTVPFQRDIPIGRIRAREGEKLQKLSDEIHETITDAPLWFYEILESWGKYEYRSLLLALTKLYEEKRIIQNDMGQWGPKANR